jgi:hypothetical protein
MKIKRIVTGHNASGKAIVGTDEWITAVPRIAAGISGCEIWSTIECRSTTRRPLTQSKGQVSSSITTTSGTVGVRRFGSTNSRLAMRGSRTAPKPMDYALLLSG